MRKKITIILSILILPGIIFLGSCKKEELPKIEKKLSKEELLKIEKNVQELSSEMKVVKLKNCTFKRFGSKKDGGYLMCENLLEGVEAAYSYGIAGRDAWGCNISRQYKVPVHQYDCFNTKRPDCDDGEFHFHEECLGDKSYKKDGRTYISFTEHIAKNKDENKKLVVKIDIEGAEWDSLLATSDTVLSNINQLGIEFHGLLEGNPKYTALIKKLKKTFYIANIHYNNWGCSPKSKFFPASVNEILFVNKKAGIIDKTAPEPVLPHPLDSPNNPKMKDCQKLP